MAPTIRTSGQDVGGNVGNMFAAAAAVTPVKATAMMNMKMKGNNSTRSTVRRLLPFMKVGLTTFTLGWVCASSIGAMKSLPLDHAAVTTIHGAAVVKVSSPPFAMPIKGEKYEIFQPLQSSLAPPLFAPAKQFISYFEDRVTWVNTLFPKKDVQTSVQEYATNMYLETIKSYVTAVVFNDAEKSVRVSAKQIYLGPFNKEKRKGGEDWTYLGDTMSGWARIDNVRDLLHDVFKHNVIGDYIETGVWRGGSSVFARAVIAAAGETDRVSYVCDSFVGLPPGDRALDKADKNWDNWPYLEIPVEVVVNNFQKYALLDSNVVFVKGFFNETMLPLSKEIKHLSVMRLDGDMYESTVDVLYRLYDKLSIGGYVIMDDWAKFPSRTACEDFFKVHGIQPEIIGIDKLSAYWQKKEHVRIQYWRYEQDKFKPGDTKA